jgi:2-iminobutanoate/2-iminopropanoate deaminase
MMQVPSKIQTVCTAAAPAAIGPYAQAVEIDGWVFTSGQIGLDPATGTLVSGEFKAEAQQVFKNLQAVLEAAGCDRSDVVKATVFLTDFADFPLLNECYAEFFGEHRPARSTVQVAALPRGARLEIELIARSRATRS